MEKGLKLPPKKVITTYKTLREMNFSPNQARSLTKRCYDPQIETEVKNFVRSSIKRAYRTKLKGEEALKYLREQFKEFQEINEIKTSYSSQHLSQAYAVTFLNHVVA